MTRTTKRVLEWIWKGVAIVASGFISGILGWLLGALIGGNLAQGFAFGGVRGYEAAGLVGYLGGTAVGVAVSCRILSRLCKPNYCDTWASVPLWYGTLLGGYPW